VYCLCNRGITLGVKNDLINRSQIDRIWAALIKREGGGTPITFDYKPQVTPAAFLLVQPDAHPDA
jgi:hypothetical protein